MKFNKMARIVLYLTAGLGLIYLYIKHVETKGIYFPFKEIQFTPKNIDIPFEDVYLKTKDGYKINGWFMPCKEARRTILFFHGNAGNIEHRLDKIKMLRDTGLNIFIIDYRGYGLSQGDPSEEGLYLDAEASYDYLINERKIDSYKIIVYGESLGCAVSVKLASEREVGALILEGAFSSAKDMAKKYYPFLPLFVFADRYNSWSRIRDINAPKLFIHSKEDEIVPINLAEKLYNAAECPKYFTELGGGHNTAFLDSSPDYINSIKEFIKKLGK